MQYNPHDYQKFATEYIEEHPIAAVLLECGLGKTSITLTAINNLMFDSFDVHKVLVIAPIRVAKLSWPDEVEKWEHLSDLIYSVAVGTEAERLKALKTPADIYLINRENVQWLVEKSGMPFDYDMVVVDELSSFKNHQSKRFKAFMKVRPKVNRVVGLTGTPSSNGLMDLFAEYKLLDKGERLGRFIGQYRQCYFKPDKCNGPIVYSYKLLPGAEQQIYEKISDITISMKSADHLKMPELINSNYMVHMDKKEKLKYVRMKQELVLQLPGGEVTAANAASLSGKLSQMANGAIYTDDGGTEIIHDRKLDALEDLIEAANGKPILVAYWFQHDLTRITESLRQLGVIYQKLDSDESIRKWNAGELQVGLIHPASAGHGLNLQSGGNTLIWFGLTWSLELYQQTVAKDIIEGRKIDPTFYPVIYGADENDDWTDPEVWKKANPSLGITVSIDKVQAACDSAKQNPGEENAFRQLRLNQWVKQAVRWMSMEKWDACAFHVNEDDLEGRVCYGGLDLSSTTDITAFVLVFPPRDEDDKFAILPYFWIPEDTLELRVRRDHVPYDVWEKQGYLMTTEGNVVHYGFIEQFIERLGERFNIREIAFDRWGAVQMVQNLEGMGFTVVPFGQGFKDMSPPTKELMKLTLEKKLAHGGHPVLRWMMDNIYIRNDPAGNIKADKEKSTEKIDGAIATIMGLDRAIRCGNDVTASVYDERGILFI